MGMVEPARGEVVPRVGMVVGAVSRPSSRNIRKNSGEWLVHKPIRLLLCLRESL